MESVPSDPFFGRFAGLVPPPAAGSKQVAEPYHPPVSGGEQFRREQMLHLQERKPVGEPDDPDEQAADERNAAGMEGRCEVHHEDPFVHQKDVRPALEVEMHPGRSLAA
jgi:hypothetical protein